MTFVELAKQRDEWLQARRAGIGGSDAATILGLTRKSPLELYAEKRGLVQPPSEEAEWLEWGKRLEPAIAEKYAEETGRAVAHLGDFTIQRHRDIPWLLATLDRQLTGEVLPDRQKCEPPPSDGPGALELKNANAFKAAEWRDEPPLIYQVQVQHQLAVTGYRWASIAVLIGGNSFRWKDIPRHEEFIAKLLRHEEEFWERVQRGHPPTPDGSKSAGSVLAALYPTEEQDLVDLPAEAQSWDQERQHAISVIATHEDVRAECENRIKAAIGSHAVGVLPNGTRYTWRTENRAAYSVAASSRRVLRRKAAK